MNRVCIQASGGLLSLEAAEVLDRMREGADRLRNNTNSFLSGELLGLVPVRISVSGESDENSLRIKSVSRHHPTGIADGTFTIDILDLFNIALGNHFQRYDASILIKRMQN